MNIKHNDILIDLENPFKNCKLEREQYASVLTGLVENYSSGFVLAINNKWGTGKTTFVKMWNQYLKNKEYQTIYFNAWENDFEDNPLTALIGELKDLKKIDQEKFQKVLKNAALISKNLFPSLIKSVANRYLDTEMLVDGISETSKGLMEIFEKDVEDYAKRKESIQEFRNNLSSFVADESDCKPLIFIIDELDRCRPNYSVSLLEQVKHFFSVPNIVFVLSIDKEQLGNAICGVYGSDKIDADEYLRRFIDIEYSIPKPESIKFFNYLYNYYDFDSFLNSKERLQHYDLQYDSDNFKSISKILIGNLTLRQQEKILSHSRIVLKTLKYNNYLIPFFFVFLIFVKVMHRKYYDKLINKSVDINEVHTEFYNIIKPFMNSENQRFFIYLEGYLLTYYQNYINAYRREFVIYKKDSLTDSYKLTISSKINDADLLSFFTNSNRMSTIFDLSLEYFINKIELTEDIKIN